MYDTTDNVRVALYARCSTSDGRQDVENQLSELREWAKRLGGEIVGEYIDEASGTKSDRVALKRLLTDAHKRHFDSVLIWSIDRLSREGVGRMAHYIEQFRSYGIMLRSHQESWLDTSGPTVDLLTAIFSWIAAFERERIAERVRAGLKRARSQGKRLGRPARAIDLERARQLKSQGYSLRQMSTTLGIPRSTLARALTNSTHI